MESKMAASIKSLGIDRLGVDERLALVDEIWASICADAPEFPLSEAQRTELDRRIADDDAFPDDVLPWADVKAAIRARLAK
jgi:putative addiction module component (TIGR02574 family)